MCLQPMDHHDRLLKIDSATENPIPNTNHHPSTRCWPKDEELARLVVSFYYPWNNYQQDRGDISWWNYPIDFSCRSPRETRG